MVSQKTDTEMWPVQASDHNWALLAGPRGEGEWVHSGITEGATVHMGEITVFNPHYLKLSYSNEENHILHFANDL